MLRLPRTPFFWRFAVLGAACLLAGLPAWGGTLLTFEGLQDQQEVGTFYPGATFREAMALVAGFSLNDAEFPPASGVTVAVPEDGDISISFDSPITNFQALFTHSDSLTLLFFLAGNPVGSASSVFTNNLAISGDPGTTPNEAISFQSNQGFDSVAVSGGGFYALDDVSFDGGGAQTSAPEASTSTLMGGALVALFGVGRVIQAVRRRTGRDATVSRTSL